ncbi:MAG: hypothetical protein PVI30_05965 [Myxococcales bacterium]|jgi:hypothetical protein
MIDDKLIKAQAVEDTKSLLANSAGFAQLPRTEKEQLFRDLYREQYSKLALAASNGGNGGNGHAQALASGRASDLIDDTRHENKRIEQAGELAGDFMREVDFPGFVRDLLKGVFDANLEVTLAQMEAYQKLLQTASQSLASFVRNVDPAAAFSRLAENEPDDFSFGFDDEEKDDEGNAKPILMDKDGNKVDTEDTKIKAKVMDATLALAREQRKLLRESILMGITRLVVEKGQVKASVIFDMKASEQVEKKDKAAKKSSRSSSNSVSASGGLLGKIFGGPSGGHTSSKRKTQISIASTKSQANTELAAKVTGFVDIQFKSDYFKLDNFLEIQKAEIAAESGQPLPGTGQAAPGGAAK